MTEFWRFELRTTDADAARAFYSAIFGHDHALIWPLHEQALARGARPHWLGHLGVGDVERASAAFVERGATRLGPSRPSHDGGQVSVLRDPGGALLALSTPSSASAVGAIGVGSYVLNTHAVAVASAIYRELFGWQLTAQLDRGPEGVFQQFAWQAGGASVGLIADVAGRPGVHPHWLYFFEVDALEPAIAATRAAGGVVLEPFVLPSAQRACVCEDPQGAAFGLCQRAPRRSWA